MRAGRAAKSAITAPPFVSDSSGWCFTLAGTPRVRHPACHTHRMYGERLAKWDRAMEWPLTIAALVFFAAYASRSSPVSPANLRAARRGGSSGSRGGCSSSTTSRASTITENRGEVVHPPPPRPRDRGASDAAAAAADAVPHVHRDHPARRRRHSSAAESCCSRSARRCSSSSSRDSRSSTPSTASGNIKSFGDAIWWSFVTMTTVGLRRLLPGHHHRAHRRRRPHDRRNHAHRRHHGDARLVDRRARVERDGEGRRDRGSGRDRCAPRSASSSR